MEMVEAQPSRVTGCRASVDLASVSNWRPMRSANWDVEAGR